jgi:hypothetical protein
VSYLGLGEYRSRILAIGEVGQLYSSSIGGRRNEGDSVNIYKRVIYKRVSY